MRSAVKNLYKYIPFKKPILDAVKAVWTPPRSMYRYLVHWSPFTIDVQGKKLKLQHHGFHFYIENEYYWKDFEKSGFEKLSSRLWISLAQQSDVILDVGANTGLYSLFARLFNPKARIFAFEPIKRNADKLLHNASLNGFHDIILVEKAASDADGTAHIFAPDTDCSTTSTLNPDTGATRQLENTTEIATIRLDSFIQQQGLKKVDLIKIDVEEFEVPVVRGLGKYIQEFRPSILIEIRNRENGQKINEMIKGAGYLIFDIDEKTKVVQRQEITASSNNNYLLCTPEVAKSVGLL